MAKKSKWKGAALSLLGSIPFVGKVKKKAKAVKKAATKIKNKVKTAKKKVVASLKKPKKKKLKKKKKKKGKVVTKARKLLNNLKKKDLLKKLKKNMKAATLAAKPVVGDFLKGAGDAALADVTFDITKPEHTSWPTVSYKVGEVFGHTVATAYGVIETAGSVALGTGGLALDATGVGAVVGVPATAVAVAGAAHGTAMATHGTQNIVQSAKDLYNLSVNNGGKSTKASKVANNGTGKGSSGGVSKNTNVDDFDSKIATNKQKGNFGEIKSSDNLLNNQSLKDAGYDLKPIGKNAPSSIDDKIVKGIDGLYENTNANSNIKYVIDEAKFGSSQLGKTAKDGPQMSNEWLTGSETGKSRILKAVDGDQKLADKIKKALDDDEVERVLSKVDSSGNVKTFRLDAGGNIIGEWP